MPAVGIPLLSVDYTEFLHSCYETLSSYYYLRLHAEYMGNAGFTYSHTPPNLH